MCKTDRRSLPPCGHEFTIEKVEYCMTNAFTAKPKTDTEWIKKANASARSSQTMARIMRDPKERDRRGFVIMPKEKK